MCVLYTCIYCLLASLSAWLNEKKIHVILWLNVTDELMMGRRGFNLGYAFINFTTTMAPRMLYYALQKSGWTVYGSKKKKTTTRMRSSSCSLKPVARKRSKLVLRERLGGLWTVAASAWWWSDRDVCSLFRRASVAVVSLYCGVVESVCVFHFHVMCIRCTCCVLNSDEDEW